MNIIKKLREAFTDCPTLGIQQLQEKLVDEPASSISMGLNYLIKQRYCTRIKIDSTRRMGRKSVWQYTYSKTKFPKAQKDESCTN